MPTAAQPAYSSRGSLRQRAISAALALAVAAAIVLLLILSGVLPHVFVPIGSRALSTFNVAAGGETRQLSPQPKPQAKAAEKRLASPPPARVLPKPIVTMPVTPPTGMIVLSREDFVGGDIGRIKGTANVGTGTATANADSASTYGPGAGPGGKRLYAAEWYREPTDTEMATYLPRNGREGFGEIACRTVERYHVEDCRVVAETPGTGFGHAVQSAAWQFLVRPPRVDGRPVLGAWVRIRYDLIRGFVR